MAQPCSNYKLCSGYIDVYEAYVILLIFKDSFLVKYSAIEVACEALMQGLSKRV
ncbi:hypothetical protein ABID22_002698 [Pontibacter aydingkolensis]